MAAIAVRAATAADLERLVAGNLALARESEGLALDPAVVREGVRAVLAELSRREDPPAFYRIAELDGRVAGQLMITTEWSDWRAGFAWWFQSVYVWPEYRRRGVFRALYAAVEAEARAAGAVGLRLYVDRRNARARAAYAALGMDGEHYRLYEAMFDG